MCSVRAEREVQLLLKEKGELKLRLTDLRRAQAFLQDIKELNRKYLDYRHEHPKEKETVHTHGHTDDVNTDFEIVLSCLSCNTQL